MLVCDEPRPVLAPGFLVRRAEQHEVALERHARPLDREQRNELQDPDRLHVDGAASVEVAVADLAAERIDRPVAAVGVDDVDVVMEHDPAERAVPGEACADVGAPRCRFHDLAREAVAVEHIREEPRAGDLVARRIGGIDGQIAAQEVDGLVADLPPVHRQAPLGVKLLTSTY